MRILWVGSYNGLVIDCNRIVVRIIRFSNPIEVDRYSGAIRCIGRAVDTDDNEVVMGGKKIVDELLSVDEIVRGVAVDWFRILC